jgi:hypothetical protein
MTPVLRPGVDIRGHRRSIALVQGGMGVGISRSGLAAASCHAPNAKTKWYKRPMFALTHGPVSSLAIQGADAASSKNEVEAAAVVRTPPDGRPRSLERAAFGAQRPC